MALVFSYRHLLRLLYTVSGNQAKLNGVQKSQLALGGWKRRYKAVFSVFIIAWKSLAGLLSPSLTKLINLNINYGGSGKKFLALPCRGSVR